MKYPEHARRIVQIGPMGPDDSCAISAATDQRRWTLSDVLARLGELQKERPSLSRRFCKKFWATLRPLYVVDPADADRLGGNRAIFPTKRPS